MTRPMPPQLRLPIFSLHSEYLHVHNIRDEAARAAMTTHYVSLVAAMRGARIVGHYLEAEYRAEVKQFNASQIPDGPPREEWAAKDWRGTKHACETEIRIDNIEQRWEHKDGSTNREALFVRSEVSYRHRFREVRQIMRATADGTPAIVHELADPGAWSKWSPYSLGSRAPDVLHKTIEIRCFIYRVTADPKELAAWLRAGRKE